MKSDNASRMNRTGKDRKGKGRKVFLLFLAVFTAMAGIFFSVCYITEIRAERIMSERKKLSGEIDWTNDMVGWLEIPDTSISYPVMQKDNAPEYYLHRDVDGRYNFYGTPFLDGRCSTESDNLLIYGHNINGRRFFGALQNFRDKEYFESHRDLIFTTRHAIDTYRIVSVIETDVSSLAFSFADTYNESDYRKYGVYLLGKSKFITEEQKNLLEIFNQEKEIWHTYQFITLSTCRTSEGKEKRLLVVAYRERNELNEITE
ncbi:MAG: class B sortase [Roseburia sp.]|nr:class B sortase [Roseburia sp.]